MNMDIGIINAARYSAGILNEGKEEGKEKGIGMLSEEDYNSADPAKKEHYFICKELFLNTFMTALSEVPWTMGRRRKRLLKTTLPHGRSGYRFTYNLPYDCARPVELSDKEAYVIDGNFICTDSVRAELLYVSNGKFLPQNTQFVPVSVTEYAEGKFTLVLSPGHVDEDDLPADFTVCESIGVLTEPETPAAYEDYPEYNAPQFEPKFYEYLEMMLAAKLAVRNTQQPRLHDTLMQKAMLIKQEAVKSTKSIAADKDKPSPWWSDRLGIHLDF